jgi:hypothetical protein
VPIGHGTSEPVGDLGIGKSVPRLELRGNATLGLSPREVY